MRGLGVRTSAEQHRRFIPQPPVPARAPCWLDAVEFLTTMACGCSIASH
jgi:hypothetical protein